MKLALLVIAPLTFALATITGCALSDETSNDPDNGNENAKEAQANDTTAPAKGDKETKLPAVNTDSVTPAMKCQQWEVIDGRRICVR